MIINSIRQRAAQPLGLAFIAGALHKAGHEVYVIDSICEAPYNFNLFYDDLYTNGLSVQEIIDRIEPDTDIIGINCMFSFNWMSDRHIIDRIHEKYPRIKIITGGEHATALPQHSLATSKGLLACVLGEGEETVVDLVNAIETFRDLKDVPGIVYKNEFGDIITNPRRDRKQDVENIARPYWDIFPTDKYFEHKLYYGVNKEGRTLPVMATRGCPYQCTFCSSANMWGTRYYMREPESVIEEIKYYKDKYKVNNIDFFDLTAIIKRAWILKFCKLLIEENLNITWQIPAGTRAEVIDEEVAYYLKKAGCTHITYAPETGSEEMLKLIKKRLNLKKMIRSIKASHKMGMNVKLNMIISFPEETHKSIWQTIRFLAKTVVAGADDMYPSVFHPYPGSEYFNRLLKEGKINIDSDQYYLDLINVNYLGRIRSFSEYVPQWMIKIYHPFYLMIFYGLNYIIRPKRFFRIIRNIFNNKIESRMELQIRDILDRKKGYINSEITEKPILRLSDFKKPQNEENLPKKKITSDVTIE